MHILAVQEENGWQGQWRQWRRQGQWWLWDWERLWWDCEAVVVVVAPSAKVAAAMEAAAREARAMVDCLTYQGTHSRVTHRLSTRAPSDKSEGQWWSGCGGHGGVEGGYAAEPLLESGQRAFVYY
ncbi:hypothetical protein CRG98_010170 [Punica granatum]|uniref:Uncharacterized protein n=1 Tax=Punica granatum TaxID=22663 RepID=A0A2I0KLI1_PUNGR|nr:hypothetical protein CRG98_010170 [Punica granatum]